MKTVYRALGFRIALYCGGALTPISAYAQQANPPAPANALAEVIVTAEKRSEPINDVPMSITAVSGSQLQQQGITNTAQLQKIVPGLTFQQSNWGIPIYQIRGIGFIDTSLGASPTVSVYVDQVPLPFAAMTEGAALDVQRVEVLKGPQGTLFGENSTGGAINYIAAKPTSVPSAGASLTYGRFNERDVDGFVAGPVAGDLTGRLAVRTEHRDGWQDSTTRDASLGKRDFSTARALLDWKPRDAVRLELNLNGWIDKSDTQANQFVAFSPTTPNGYPEASAALSRYQPAPQNDRAADWDPNSSFARDDQFYQTSLRGDWDISERLKLTSISAYARLRARTPTDADGTDFNDETVNLDGTLESTFQELRLAGRVGNSALWMAGVNYANDRANEDQLDLITSSNSGVGPFRYHGVILENHQDAKTKAAFASLDYRFADGLSAQGSLRYTSQDRAFAGCLRDDGDGRLATAFSALSTELSQSAVNIPAGDCVTFGADNLPVGIVTSQLNQNNLSWRASLNWHPDPDMLIYGNVTKGFKAGGFSTIPGIKVSQYRPVTQESVLAYEIGFKFAPISRPLQLTGAVFYDDYKDKQILGFVDTGVPFGTLPTLVNVPKSSVSGAELNLRWRPIRALTLSFGGTYVHSRVVGDYLANDQAGSLVDIRDEQFPNAPKWQFMGDAEYDFAVHDGWSAFLGASSSYKSTSYAFFGESPYFKMGGYALLDLRAGMESADSRWRAELFGHNVTDRYYFINAAHPLDTFTRTTGMPATYGVTVSYRWN